MSILSRKQTNVHKFQKKKRDLFLIQVMQPRQNSEKDMEKRALKLSVICVNV
ncbi:hypothetical protein CHCC20331_3236 [Bacillus paralicheniformis]|nr:hypothetical protein CHCC20331_3236 [Bacillus paralicheniformis]